MKLFTFSNKFFLLLLLTSEFICAQLSDTLRFPPGLIIPNYNRAPVGQIEASEGGAFVARTTGPIANWYNPAGLAIAESVLSSAGSSGYDIIKLKLDGFKSAPHSLTSNGIPGFIGLVTKAPFFSTKKAHLGLSVGQQSSWQPVFDSDTKVNVAGTNDQLSISYKLKFSSAAPALSLGVISNSRFRWGVGIQFPFTTLNIYESIGEQILSGTSITSDLLNFRVNGLVANFIGVGGAQYSLSDYVILGGLVKSPGIRIWNNAQISYESTQSSTDSTKSIAFHDNNAKFHYNLPLQLSFGIAYKSNSFQIEADLTYFNGAKPYTVLMSDLPVTRYETRFEAPFTTQILNFPDLSYDRNQVLNAALGGHIKISDLFRVHGGIFSDLSPVNSSNSRIFRKINLFGTTVGLSLTSENVGGGIGFKYSFGRSKPFTIGQSSISDQVTTHLDVSTFTIIWALTLGV